MGIYVYDSSASGLPWDRSSAAPSASIKTLFAASPPLTILNGRWQGCLLSPLLFALCIKPLAAWFRQEPNIRGILVRGRKFKISLFVDDILLTLTHPRVTLPNLHKLLNLDLCPDTRLTPLNQKLSHLICFLQRCNTSRKTSLIHGKPTLSNI